MTATFPYLPDWGASPEMPQAINKVAFGDGYEQRSHKGLNPYLPIWSLTFSKRTQAEAEAIAAWFQANKADVAAFNWTTPGANTTATDELFFTGDGSTSSAQLTKGGDAITSGILISSLTRTDWQGTVQLSPTPRTNLRLYSQDFTIAAWIKTNLTVTPDATTAPDGTNTADLLVTAAVTGSMRVYRGVASVAGQRRCSSWYVKKQPGSVVRWLVLSADQSGALAWFDLDNGVFGNIGSGITALVSALSNGWYRVSITYNAAGNDSGDNQFLTVVAGNGNLTNITGDGVTGFYVWGAQVEDSAEPTSYIPTDISIVTVTDYTISSTGVVAFGQTPISGATFRWSGTYTIGFMWVADSWTPAKPDEYNSWSVQAKFRQVAA